MLSLSPLQRYFVYNGYTDMRKSFDGLCGLVSNDLAKNPTNGDVFIFFNRPLTHVKILFWERDGFALYYKRLERGTYDLPSTDSQAEVSAQVLSFILQGIILSSVKRKKRYEKSE